MVGLFKQKSPGNIFILFIFGLLIKLPLFLHPRNATASAYEGRLYHLLIDDLPQPNGFVASLFALGFLFVQALMITYLVNEYRMVPRQNYLPGMAYLLITSLLPEWTYLSAPLVCNTLLIWILVKLLRLYGQPYARPQIFNIGLLTGLASYIYFPSAVFIVCILIGIMILKPFRLNEVVLFLIGCITSYYFYAVYLFLNDRFHIRQLFPSISLRVPQIRSTIWLAASTLLIGIPFLIGGFFIQIHLRKMLIQVRKNWSILLMYLLLAFFVPFINSNQSFTTWVLIAVPFAAFHACAYFYQKREWLNLVLFFITVGFIFYLQYGTGTWRV